MAYTYTMHMTCTCTNLWGRGVKSDRVGSEFALADEWEDLPMTTDEVEEEIILEWGGSDIREVVIDVLVPLLSRGLKIPSQRRGCMHSGRELLLHAPIQQRRQVLPQNFAVNFSCVQFSLCKISLFETNLARCNKWLSCAYTLQLHVSWVKGIYPRCFFTKLLSSICTVYTWLYMYTVCTMPWITLYITSAEASCLLLCILHCVQYLTWTVNPCYNCWCLNGERGCSCSGGHWWTGSLEGG